MPPIIFERATLLDLEALCDLLAVLFSQEAEFTVDRDKQRAGLTAILKNSDVGVILLARNQTRVVGMVSLLFTVSTALGGRVAWLEDMVVLPEYRACGVGSQLLQAAMIEAKRLGCLRVSLLTDGDNDKAHVFYQRLGFVQSEMRVFRQRLD